MERKQSEINILVIGDGCVDEFIYCDIERICPEAPVPVFMTLKEETNGGMARNVYDRFTKNLTQESNKKLCEIREVFEKYNLISGLHTFMSQKDDRFKNLLPPLKVLDSQDKIDLLTNLKNIKFEINQLKAA